uniref:TRP C-terminal domain-containing protein n=1 Tax=Amphimedon queenslandica TaxID=400682 RepID=A0A1X7UL01_AMPQE
MFTYSLEEANCSYFEYSPAQFIYTRHKVVLSLPYNELVNNFAPNSHIVSYYTMHECPIGFSMDSNLRTCACSQGVSRENVTCDIASQNISHNGLLWIGTYHTSTPFNANATNPNACIINEDCLLYCSPNPVTFQLNDTDTQCVDNRGQRMCGSCRERYSLLMGSNKCGQCHNNYMMIAWIALFAVMGVLLVVLLIALNLTVSVGTLNGLLFYANIVKLYEPVFSRKGALPVLNQVISWINLDFGFEICFYNGMDTYAKQWLQFAFPFYLWFVIIVIRQLCRRYGKISRLMGSHAVPVLSTLFLLSYTKLVRTIFIVLNKREVALHCTNESIRSVSLWYEDPNVEYAKGKHAWLFGFALFVSITFVIPYTLFLLFNPFIEKYLSNYKLFRKCWSRFKPIVDAYSGPMKDEYRFWPGLLLVARIPILLSVTLVDSFIQSHYFLLFMLLTVLAIVLSLGYSFRGVYRKRMHNILEVWFLFILCMMVGFSVAYTDDSVVEIWFNTCLSLFTASFILIVLYHLYLQLSQAPWYNVLVRKLFTMLYNDDDDDEPLLDVTDSHKTVDEQRNDIVPSSTDVFRHRRESVVDLF